MFGLFLVLLVDVIVLVDVMVAQHQLQVAMLVAPISLAPQGTRRRRTRVHHALWESLHLHLVSARALPVQLARTSTSLGLPIASNVLQASTLSSMAHRPTKRAWTVRQARIWRQWETVRCPLAWHVMQASTQSYMAHHPTRPASTVRQVRTWRQSAKMRSQIAWHVMQASTLSSMAQSH